MPAKVIANPVAELGFFDKGFTTGFASAAKTVKEFSSNFSSQILGTLETVGKFTGIGAIIAGALGGIGVGALVEGQMEAIDSTAKLSDRLGIATEQLTGLQHAANLSGVSSEQLSTGLGFLLKNMADAANGGKETSAAFKSLGLDAKDLIGLPTDVAFGKISDALNAIDNPAQKAGAAVKIFGKAGQELLPLLAEGSKGLAEMSDDAVKLGISFNRVDAAKVEEANDAITRLKDVFIGIADQIGIAIAPGVTYVANAFTDLGIQVVTIFRNILPPITGAISSLFDIVVSYISPIFDWISSNSDAILGTVAQIVAVEIGYVSDILSGLWSFVETVFNGIVAVIDYCIQSVGESIGILIGWFGGDVPAAFDGTGSSMQVLGAIFGWLKDTILDVLTVTGYTIKNWQLALEIVWLEVATSVTEMVNTLVYQFTDVIPAYLSWFADNWSEILTDVMNFTGTVFENMGKNIAGFFTAIYSWFKGDGFNFEWTGLTEGFASTIKELPKIAEREVGPLEGALNDELSKSQQKYMDGLGQKVVDQNNLTTDIKQGIKNAVKTPQITPSTAKGAAFDPNFADSASDKTKSSKDEGTAILTGSGESLALADMKLPGDTSDDAYFGGTDSTPQAETPDIADNTTDKDNPVITFLKQYLPDVADYLAKIADNQTSYSMDGNA